MNFLVRFEFFDCDLIEAQKILDENQHKMSLGEFWVLLNELSKRGYRFGVSRTPESVDIVFNEFPKKSFYYRLKEFFSPRKKLSYQEIAEKASPERGF